MSLYECLHVFCLPDSLTKDNKYDCGRCKAKTDASKSFAFLHLPEVLVIHIKRFNFSNYWGSKKNDTGGSCLACYSFILSIFYGVPYILCGDL